MGLDQALFRAINGLVGQWAPLDWAMRGLANDYLVPVTLGLTLLGLWFSPRPVRQRLQRGVMAAAAAAALVNAFIKAINLVYSRPRPFAQMEVNLLFYPPTDPSFPSNQAGFSFAIAFAILLAYPRVGLALFLPVLLVSLARVYVGVHFPADILGGWALGALSGWLGHRLLGWLKPLPERILELARRFHLA